MVFPVPVFCGAQLQHLPQAPVAPMRCGSPAATATYPKIFIKGNPFCVLSHTVRHKAQHQKSGRAPPRDSGDGLRTSSIPSPT
jgi:hypothetical protein